MLVYNEYNQKKCPNCSLNLGRS